MRNICVPVSYTHLDVYKRQAVAGLEEKTQAATEAATKANEAAAKAENAAAKVDVHHLAVLLPGQ